MLTAAGFHFSRTRPAIAVTAFNLRTVGLDLPPQSVQLRFGKLLVEADHFDLLADHSEHLIEGVADRQEHEVKRHIEQDFSCTP